MAEMILPLTRTLFLPAGCPGLGSVESVSGDLREVCCGSTGGEAYCMGEADILVEYTAPLRPAGLFESGGGGRPGSWQALLAFPFQLCGRGTLPRDSACRVELGPLNWTMVASRAIELETTVRVSYDLPEDEATGRPRPETAACDGERDVICRRAGAKERERDGEWQMVSIKEDDMQERAQVEIVDLSGGAEQERIRQALAQALATPGSGAGDLTLASLGKGAAVEKGGWSLTETVPELEAAGAAGEAKNAGVSTAVSVCPPGNGERPGPQQTRPALGPEEERQAAKERPGDEEAMATPIIQLSFDAPEPAPHPVKNPPDVVPDLPLPTPEEDPGPERSPEWEGKEGDDHDLGQQPKQSPQPLPGPLAEPADPDGLPPSLIKAEEISVEAEVLDTAAEEAPRPKRRFRGLPGLHVEAHDNDIDVTAFHISIKL